MNSTETNQTDFDCRSASHLMAIETLNSLSPDQIEQMSRLQPVDLHHYLKMQRKWLQDSQYYLGIDMGCPPSAAQIAEKILESEHPKRFRCYYAIRFPDKMNNLNQTHSGPNQ